ncbi:MAG: hypothetical protein IPM24_05020 [Bryobacterales bacterium]|nr:hypothetical protein [Bryobacterales bacterium]
MRLTRRKLLLGLAAGPLLPGDAAPGTHLLLDSRVTAQVEGARLRLGTVTKDRANPLFGEERPWEVRFDNLYANVLRDDDGWYKCWYSPFIVDPAVSETPRGERSGVPYRPRGREMGVCFARSRDGIAWEKPGLGLIEFAGSRRNNLVSRGPHGAGVWRDDHDPDPARRYKMFFSGDRQTPGLDRRAVACMVSADGLRWTNPVSLDAIDAPADTHNFAFWSEELQRYVGFTRLREAPPRRHRLVGRTESPDFIHWTKAAEVFRSLPGEETRQTYAMPVFRYGSAYLGLIMMFNTDSDKVDCELAWSPDTVRWERVCPGTPLIPRGPEGSYDAGCVYAAAHPVVERDEIRLYYGGSNGPHTGWRDGSFCLARLRPDGFAGYAAESGSIVTKRVRCTGSRLLVTADGGLIRAGVRGLAGREPGDAKPLTGAVTARAVEWRGGDLPADRDVELVFELRDATLYAFRFAA